MGDKVMKEVFDIVVQDETVPFLYAIQNQTTFEKAKWSIKIASQVYGARRGEPRIKCEVGGIGIITPLARDLWDRTPLGKHLFIEPTHADFDLLDKSIEHLEKFVPDLWSKLKPYLGNIGVLELPSSEKGVDSEITSITLPGFPYLSFISKMAYQHLPPAVIVQKPHLEILAENLLHESIHQFANHMIVDKGVFSSDYHSNHSPKVSIPWRKNMASDRNRFWEIDRCFHAAMVYLGIYYYRKSGALKSIHGDLVKGALENLSYLAEALASHHRWFTPMGQKLVMALWDQSKREC